MLAQFTVPLHRVDLVKVRRVADWARIACAAGALAVAVDPVMAQSLKQAGVNIFNVIYGVVGVIGAIACLLTLLNWVTGNWLGRDDPKKIFFQALLGTALAFGIVAIIQFVKDMVGGVGLGHLEPLSAMMEVGQRHEEPALERAVIYRGPQAPVLQAYVPLPVFGAECMLLLLCMRLFGFWTLLLLPLHLVLVLKTNDNPFWLRDLVASYRHHWFARNKNTHGRGVVSFSPHLNRREVQ